MSWYFIKTSLLCATLGFSFSVFANDDHEVTAKSCYAAVIAQGLVRPEANRVQIGLPNGKPGVVYKGRQYNSIVAEASPFLQSMRFRNISGWAPEGVEALMAFLHGIGADISNAGTMLLPLSMFSPEKTKRQSGSTSNIHKKYPFVRIGGEIVDLPENGYGPEGRDLATLLDQLAAEYQAFKERAPGRPLFGFGRSASTGIFVALNKRYPGLFDGLILMAPMSSDPVAMEASMAGYYSDLELIKRQLAEGKEPYFVPNKPAVDYMLRLYADMDFHLDAKPLGDLPVLFLVGSEDVQTPVAAREIVKKMAATNPNAQYVEIQKAGHDVISIAPGFEAIGEKAYGIIYQFISGVISKKL